MNTSTRILKFNSESDGEDSDNFDEVFYSASSYDRSSINSIPWAEDAIKQNLEEWERIERIFYDEESITSIKNDKDLCREILELKKSFPHLRINGRKIMSPNIEIRRYSTGTSNEDNIMLNNFDTELLPSQNENLTFIAKKECTVHKTRKKGMQSALIGQSKLSIFGKEDNYNFRNDDSALLCNLGNNLRISSVPINKLIRVPNRQYCKNLIEKPQIKQNNLPNLVPIPITSASFSKKQHLNFTTPINSTSYIRMPPIFSVIHHNPRILNNCEQTTKVYIAAQKFAPRRQNSTIILPSIDNNDKNQDYARGTNRSISAVAGFNLSSPFRNGFEKYIE